MPYTSADLYPILLRANQCFANLGYEAFNKAMRGRPDNCCRDKAEVIGNIIDVLKCYTSEGYNTSVSTATLDFSFLPATINQNGNYTVTTNLSSASSPSVLYATNTALIAAIAATITGLGLTAVIAGTSISVTTSAIGYTDITVNLTLFGIDIVNKQISGSIEYTSLSNEPIVYGAFNPDDNKYWFGSNNGLVTFDTTFTTQTITLLVGNYTGVMGYNSTAKRMFMVTSTGLINIIDGDPLSGTYQTVITTIGTGNGQVMGVYHSISNGNTYIPVVSNVGVATLFVVDGSNALIASITDIDLDFVYNLCEIDFLGTNVYVACHGSGKVLVVDGNPLSANYNTIINSFIPVIPPLMIKVVNGIIYVYEDDGSAFVIEKMTSGGIFSSTTSMLEQGKFFSTNGTELYVVSGNSTLDVYNSLLQITQTYTNINFYLSLLGQGNHVVGIVSQDNLLSNVLVDPDFGASQYANIIPEADGWNTDPTLDGWVLDAGTTWTPGNINIAPGAVGLGLQKDITIPETMRQAWEEWSFIVTGVVTVYDIEVFKGGLSILQANSGSGGFIAQGTPATGILRIQRAGDIANPLDILYFRLFTFSLNWGFNNDWRISGVGGTLRKYGSASDFFYIGTPITVGLTYMVVFDVKEVTTGFISVIFGGTTKSVFAAGVYTFFIQAASAVVKLGGVGTGLINSLTASPLPVVSYIADYLISNTPYEAEDDFETVETFELQGCPTDLMVAKAVETLKMHCSNICGCTILNNDSNISGNVLGDPDTNQAIGSPLIPT